MNQNRVKTNKRRRLQTGGNSVNNFIFLLGLVSFLSNVQMVACCCCALCAGEEGGSALGRPTALGWDGAGRGSGAVPAAGAGLQRAAVAGAPAGLPASARDGSWSGGGVGPRDRARQVATRSKPAGGGARDQRWPDTEKKEVPAMVNLTGNAPEKENKGEGKTAMDSRKGGYYGDENDEIYLMVVVVFAGDDRGGRKSLPKVHRKPRQAELRL